jgi:hypothetical protein
MSFRCLYELFLSGTLASAFLIALIHSSIYWSAQFFGWEMGVNHSFHRTYNDHVGYNCAFCLWALALTLAVFSALRVLSRFSLATKTLRTIGGAIVIAVPLMCLGFVSRFRPDDIYWGWPWLRFEGCAAAGCALLYACNRWPISLPTTVVLLTVHGILWLHAYAVTFEVYGSCLLTPPISAYFSILMWGHYVKRHCQQQGVLHEMPT